MHWFRYIAAVAALVVCSAAPAHAQKFISPYIGFNFGGDSANCVSLSSCEEKRTNVGLSIGGWKGIMGFEQDFGYAPSFFGKSEGGSNAVLTVMSNVLISVPIWRIHPYGIVGIGLIRPHLKLDAASLAQNNNSFGYDIGGGVNIYLIQAIGLRGDVRKMKTLTDLPLGFFSDEKLEFWRATAGLTFSF
jgi:hypothetical protein